MSVGQSECPEEVKNCPKNQFWQSNTMNGWKISIEFEKIEIVVRNDV